MRQKAIAFYFVVVAVFASAEAPLTLLSLKNRVGDLSNRVIQEASEEETLLLSSFKQFLVGQGLAFEEVILSDPLIGHSFSRMLRIRGDDRDAQLIFFFPINGRGAVMNLLAAADLLLKLGQDPPQVSYEVIVSGSADPLNHQEGLAIEFFLRDLRFVETKAMVYIDATAEGPAKLQTIAAGINSPIWMIKSLLETAASTYFPLEIKEVRPSFFRFFLEGRESPLDQTVLHGLRSVRLSWNPELASGVSDFLARWIRTFPSELTKNWDKHFVMFGQGTNSLILDQKTYILFLVFFLLMMILSMFFLRETFELHLEALRKGFWQVGVYFSIVFLFSYLSSMAITLLRDQILSESDGWEGLALIFLFWKVFFFVFLYVSFIRYTRRLPLFRWSIFYQAAAVFLYSVYSVVAFALNFGFSFFFIWSFVLSLLYIIVPFRPLKIVLVVLLPIWPLYSLVQTFLNEVDLSLLYAVLFDPIEANLVITLYFLPIFFLFHAYHFQRHQKFERNETFQISLLFLFSGVILFGLTYLILNWPVSRVSFPMVTETVQVDRQIGKLEVIRAAMEEKERVRQVLGARLVADSETQWSASVKNLSDVRLVFRQNYLNRRVFRYEVVTKPQALHYRISLHSTDAPLVVLESNFPYEQQDLGRKIIFLIGRYPPRQLTLNFVLQGGTKAEMKVMVEYRPHPDFSGPEFERWTTELTEERILPLE